MSASQLLSVTASIFFQCDEPTFMIQLETSQRHHANMPLLSRDFRFPANGESTSWGTVDPVGLGECAVGRIGRGLQAGVRRLGSSLHGGRTSWDGWVTLGGGGGRAFRM
jgi:hypothetical protein